MSSETMLNQEKILQCTLKTEEKDYQNLKFPVSSFSSSLAKGTRAWPRPVLLPLRPWWNAFGEKIQQKIKTSQKIGATRSDIRHLLQKPVLGVELPEKVEDPCSVKLVPEVQAFK